MPQVLLGNASVIVPELGAQGTVNDAIITAQPRPELGQQITTIHPPVGAVEDQIAEIATAWRSHSAGFPAWVESDDPALEAALAEHFGCPVGCPVSHDEWKAA